MSETGFVITEKASNKQFICQPDEFVLAAMERQGMHCIAVGCRGGGCGVCRVRVISGDYQCGRMSKAHVSPSLLNKGYALACRLKPTSDLIIECAPSALATNSVTNVAKSNLQLIELR